jgi:hypothetical protein
MPYSTCLHATPMPETADGLPTWRTALPLLACSIIPAGGRSGRRLSSRCSPGAGQPARPGSFARHHITNPHIELDGDKARARSYFTVWSNRGPDHAGTYDDVLVARPEGWRFAHRRVRIDWQSEVTLFHPMVTRPA